jgi:Collagen triple helix repeat (20 copies)
MLILRETLGPTGTYTKNAKITVPEMDSNLILLYNLGLSGSSGQQGLQGYQGYQGNDGFQGYQGNDGFQGYQGNDGFQGYQGNDGFQGYQGNDGFQGFQGGNSAEIITYQRIVPADGGSYYIPDGNSLYMNLNEFGSIMSYSVYMPPNPVDGQVVHIIISNNNIYDWDIYNLNILPNDSQLVDNAAPTNSLWPNRSSSYMWVSVDLTWARMS